MLYPSSRNCFMNDTNTTPLSTAIPHKLINPTAAGTDKYSPAKNNPKTPPMEANGNTKIIRLAKRRDLNNINSRKNIAKIVSGIMMIKRSIARCMFSNCPPHCKV